MIAAVVVGLAFALGVACGAALALLWSWLD